MMGEFLLSKKLTTFPAGRHRKRGDLFHAAQTVNLAHRKQTKTKSEKKTKGTVT
jgi:hypothetical protein